MCGTDDADVDLERVVVAHAADLAALEHAQQLGLHGSGQFADFVQEQRAAVGDLEQADPVIVGAGEGAFAVAEQLALDQVFGQRAAIDGDERHVASRALVVHGAGHQFLAGAGFAADQHGGVRGGDFRDQLADALHRQAVADQAGRRPPSARAVA